jgi:thermostable 8-oxoguanine DNA glycosylase
MTNKEVSNPFKEMSDSERFDLLRAKLEFFILTNQLDADIAGKILNDVKVLFLESREQQLSFSKEELQEIHGYLAELRREYLKPYQEQIVKRLEYFCQELEEIMYK